MLRKLLARIDALGELQMITGANWDLEIGAITEVCASFADSKALLFDENVGCPKGLPGTYPWAGLTTSQRAGFVIWILLLAPWRWSERSKENSRT